MFDCATELQERITQYYREMILGSAFSKLSEFVENPKQITVKVKLSDTIESEPLELGELLRHTAEFSAGVTELFQIKAIAAWNDYLNNVFRFLLHAQLHGGPQVLDYSFKLNLKLISSLPDIEKQATRDYSFERYIERVRLLKKGVPQAAGDGPLQVELKLIRKHVEIRNSLQHHNGIVTRALLNDLGSDKLALLDANGKVLNIGEGDRIMLYIPELNFLKQAIYRVSRTWAP